MLSSTLFNHVKGGPEVIALLVIPVFGKPLILPDGGSFRVIADQTDAIDKGV